MKDMELFFMKTEIDIKDFLKMVKKKEMGVLLVLMVI